MINLLYLDESGEKVIQIKDYFQTVIEAMEEAHTCQIPTVRKIKIIAEGMKSIEGERKSNGWIDWKRMPKI